MLNTRNNNTVFIITKEQTGSREPYKNVSQSSENVHCWEKPSVKE